MPDMKSNANRTGIRRKAVPRSGCLSIIIRGTDVKMKANIDSFKLSSPGFLSLKNCASRIMMQNLVNSDGCKVNPKHRIHLSTLLLLVYKIYPSVARLRI